MNIKESEQREERIEEGIDVKKTIVEKTLKMLRETWLLGQLSVESISKTSTMVFLYAHISLISMIREKSNICF